MTGTSAFSSSSDVERAREMDFREASELFVDAFFIDGRSNPDGKEILSLERAQQLDLSKRYSNSKRGAMFIVRDPDTCDLLACCGVEYRRYLGDYDYDSVPEDIDRFSLGSSTQRPIIANLAVGRKYRKKGYAKELVRECEREAAAAGFEEVALIVENNNRKARSLYKKLGYKVVKKLSNQNALKMQSDGVARIQKAQTSLMRKSLTNSHENIDLFDLAPLVVLAVAYVVRAEVLSVLSDVEDFLR